MGILSGNEVDIGENEHVVMGEVATTAAVDDYLPLSE
jgi:hypothetical protein